MSEQIPTGRRSSHSLASAVIPALGAATALAFVTGLLLVALAGWGLDPGTKGRDAAVLAGAGLLVFSATTLLTTYLATRNVRRALLTEIDAHLDDRVDAVTNAVLRTTDDVKDSVRETGGDFLALVSNVVPLIGKAQCLGLDNVYLNRIEALRDFGRWIMEELREAEEADSPVEPGARPRLWITASSIKGVKETSVGHPDAEGGFDGTSVMPWAGRLAATGRLDLRILLTHPTFADLRAAQEGRSKGAIPHEIAEGLRFLEWAQVPSSAVRFMRAAPTVFAIATRTRMLLNPYPYPYPYSYSYS